MLKLILGFVAFAAVSLFVIMQGGENLSMSGESHSGDSHTAAPAPGQGAAKQ